MILRLSDPSWAEAKRQLGDANFIKSLVFFDKDNISDKTLKRIGQICAKPDFKPDTVGRVSLAAKSLCMWVRAMEVYGRIFRVVEPKKKVITLCIMHYCLLVSILLCFEIAPQPQYGHPSKCIKSSLIHFFTLCMLFLCCRG